jgi:poly-D-alanine transfer protein DltD
MDGMSLILKVAQKVSKAREMVYTLTKSEDAKWYDYHSNSDSPNRKAIIKKVTQLAKSKGFSHVYLADASHNHIDTFQV